MLHAPGPRTPAGAPGPATARQTRGESPGPALPGPVVRVCWRSKAPPRPAQNPVLPDAAAVVLRRPGVRPRLGGGERARVPAPQTCPGAAVPACSRAGSRWEGSASVPESGAGCRRGEEEDREGTAGSPRSGRAGRSRRTPDRSSGRQGGSGPGNTGRHVRAEQRGNTDRRARPASTGAGQGKGHGCEVLSCSPG